MSMQGFRRKMQGFLRIGRGMMAFYIFALMHIVASHLHSPPGPLSREVRMGGKRPRLVLEEDILRAWSRLRLRGSGGDPQEHHFHYNHHQNHRLRLRGGEGEGEGDLLNYASWEDLEGLGLRRRGEEPPGGKVVQDWEDASGEGVSESAEVVEYEYSGNSSSYEDHTRREAFEAAFGDTYPYTPNATAPVLHEMPQGSGKNHTSRRFWDVKSQRWRIRKPKKDPVHVVIDKEHRRIRVLDNRGVEVAPGTGRPRKLPRLRVMEVPIPSFVSPNQVFTYCIAGHGHVRLRAPATIPESTESFTHPLRPMMVICVPDRDMAAVRSRYTDLGDNAFYDGQYTNHLKLPAEICYTDPRVMWIRGGDAPTNASDGEWLVPMVNESEYRREYAAALEEDADAAWDFYLELDGSIVRQRVRGRIGRRRGNPWGTKKNNRDYMLWDSNGLSMKPDVHFPTPVGSLQRNYTQLVDGDCPNCTTYPPSRLALRTWLPRMMRKQYMMLVNVSEAATQGDAVCAAALPYFNITALMERMSLEQKRKFNNGRLRIRYAFRDKRIQCKECGGVWSRRPFELNGEFNESLVETTYEWMRRRQLFVCAADGDVEALRDLNESLGCDLDARDADHHNCTALHMAAYHDHAAVVRQLCEWNCSLEAVCERNWTALHWACEMSAVQAGKALIDAGADVNRPGGLAEYGDVDTSLFTPLHWAAYVGSVPLVRMLVEAGARLNTKDTRGHTPLHVAAMWAHASACEALVHMGADDLEEESNGRTAAQIADECYVWYHFEHLRPDLWKHSPLGVFPGPSAWKECAERLRRAVHDRLAEDRRRLEMVASGALG